GMDVVDLGTEFGVAITAARQADVQVFEGVVEVGRPGPAESSDRRRLGIGQAVHIDGERGLVETAEFAPTGFARVMPGELEDPGLDRGLVAWWTFAETSGTVVRDASGHGHYGELVGAGFTMERAGVPGRVGRALAFDGHSTFIKVAHSEDFELNALSIQAWIRPEGLQEADAQIFSRNRCYGLGVGGNHWFKWYFWDRDALLPWDFASGRWYHLVATFDGAQRECWIDGVKLGSLASNPPPARSGEVMIGTLGARDSCVFHGAIDDLRIYDRALGSDEIRALYLRGVRPPAP
nr:LamG domain-containing protein [Planctomycetota bacterium]